MAGIKIVDLPAVGRDLISTDLLELSLAGGTGSRKITGQEIMNASKLNIGTTAITSGTVGRVLFEGTGNVVQESANLTWDNTNSRLALNGTLGKLMFPAPEISFGSRFNGIHFTDSTYATSYGYLSLSSGFGEFRMFAASSYFPTFYSNGAERMRIFTTGNIGINTTTDAGFKLDVNGTARVSGVVTLNNTSGTNRSTDLRTSNSIDNLPTTTFYPSSGTNVGQSFQVIPRGTGFSAGIKAQFALSGTDTIADGTNFEAMVVRATGSAFTFASGKGGTGVVRPMLFSSGFLDGVTNANQLWLYSTGNVGINTSTDNGFLLDVNGTARVSGNTTITSADVANPDVGPPAFNIFNGTFSKFNVVYNAAGCRVNILGTSTQGLRIDTGSSTNFSTIGGGGLTFSCSTNNFQIISASVLFNVAGAERARFAPSTGNLLINTTTDAGFRLDVNGTARVSGLTTLSDGLRINGGWTTFNASTIFGSSAQSGNTFNFATQYIGGATGTTNYFNFSGTLTSQTGGSFNVFNVQQTFSNTNSAQTFRGFYYNPNITGLQAGTTHFAFHSTSGRVRFEGLPTSPTGLNAGDLYNNLGVLMIV